MTDAGPYLKGSMAGVDGVVGTSYGRLASSSACRPPCTWAHNVLSWMSTLPFCDVSLSLSCWTLWSGMCTLAHKRSPARTVASTPAWYRDSRVGRAVSPLWLFTSRQSTLSEVEQPWYSCVYQWKLLHICTVNFWGEQCKVGIWTQNIG